MNAIETIGVCMIGAPFVILLLSESISLILFFTMAILGTILVLVGAFVK